MTFAKLWPDLATPSVASDEKPLLEEGHPEEPQESQDEPIRNDTSRAPSPGTRCYDVAFPNLDMVDVKTIIFAVFAALVLLIMTVGIAQVGVSSRLHMRFRSKPIVLMAKTESKASKAGKSSLRQAAGNGSRGNVTLNATIQSPASDNATFNIKDLLSAILATSNETGDANVTERLAEAESGTKDVHFGAIRMPGENDTTGPLNVGTGGATPFIPTPEFWQFISDFLEEAKRFGRGVWRVDFDAMPNAEREKLQKFVRAYQERRQMRRRLKSRTKK